MFSKAVFEIDTKSGNMVYMSVARTNALNERRSVVEVDAAKFADLCSAVSNAAQPWESDYKFHEAEKGFAAGASNPVPLANVECHEYTASKPVYARRLLVFRHQVGIEHSQHVHTSIINGITRTKWLLANGVKSFPVECSTREAAELLRKCAGVAGRPVRTVDELLPITRNAQSLGDQVKGAADKGDGRQRPDRGRLRLVKPRDDARER